MSGPNERAPYSTCCLPAPPRRADGAAMSHGYRKGVGELAPKLILPSSYQQRLRIALADIEEASSPDLCQLAKQLAIGLVGGLELAKALEPERIERLFILIENVASARLLALGEKG